jgi:hypothetical protein
MSRLIRLDIVIGFAEASVVPKALENAVSQQG